MRPTSLSQFAVLLLISSLTLAHGAQVTPPNNNTNPPMMAKNASGTLGTIERLDPALDALLAPDAKLEILVENVQWAEGPVWFTGVATANCGWGDDGSTLYICANHNVCRIKTVTRGIMPGSR